jgi:hypothetical protein
LKETLASLPWIDKISNHAQLGGIETSVIDNCAGRGTRIAWINTGTGLRYKVVLDRAMDIADAFYNQHSIAWLSHLGVSPPQPFSNHGLDWLRTFGGGLLVTCGLSHMGGPEEDSFGERGLHGLISNSPAEIESIIQPDPAVGKLDFSITGKIKETKIFGPSLELRRTISGTLGKSSIHIHDEIVNRGNTPAPHMLLYHFNFGWPLVDEGAELIWKGELHARMSDSKIFKAGNDYKKCPAPLDHHNGSGEDVAFIDAVADDAGICMGGVYNQKLDLGVAIRFSKKQLPWLTNWQHWGKGEYVVGIEPGTNQVIGQSKAREQKELNLIAPGASRVYDLELEVIHNNKDRKIELLKNN